MADFFQLNPGEILTLIEKAGYEPSGHCMALNSLENRVFNLRLEDGTHIISKFYRPGRWTREQILEEHQFLLDLKEEEIPVCAPLPFPDGTSLACFQDEIFYSFWPRVGGRSPDELSSENLRILGRLLGRIHNVGQSKTLKHRITLDSNTYGTTPLELLTQGDWIPSSCKKEYQETALRIFDLFQEKIESVPMLRIHGDCHKGNLLHGKEGWFFVDFDDSLCGPAVQDFWMLLSRGQEGIDEREHLVAGYREFRDFDDRWFELIEILRAMRFIHYSAWISNRFETDPSFPTAFPHFIGNEYWEKETLELKEQYKLIQGSLGDKHFFSVTDSQPKEEELTNKDFFWDLED
ncbi:serine/threonine protein kinase [Leptospira stimsonii]|uniref:Stress response kinase A n=1 Tax=Leptospira stimsonii TaxID=2202203 RepID=A0ABY2N080_9LEPT|nr:serine/threonine protein kinase [Leptospira stimsonii]TGK25159.1 serine/threonine protein kinase [Leptospira stimsonii]TGM13096.1 serine/threonine protein kinase [Leptospira stimsonii]